MSNILLNNKYYNKLSVNKLSAISIKANDILPDKKSYLYSVLFQNNGTQYLTIDNNFAYLEFSNNDIKSIIEFTDRPFRQTTYISLEDLDNLFFMNNNDSFKNDPPNAVLVTEFGQKTFEIVSINVNNTQITYNLKILDSEENFAVDTISGQMSLFIDDIEYNGLVPKDISFYGFNWNDNLNYNIRIFKAFENVGITLITDGNANVFVIKNANFITDLNAFNINSTNWTNIDIEEAEVEESWKVDGYYENYTEYTPLINKVGENIEISMTTELQLSSNLPLFTNKFNSYEILYSQSGSVENNEFYVFKNNNNIISLSNNNKNDKIDLKKINDKLLITKTSTTVKTYDYNNSIEPDYYFVSFGTQKQILFYSSNDKWDFYSSDEKTLVIS